MQKERKKEKEVRTLILNCRNALILLRFSIERSMIGWCVFPAKTSKRWLFFSVEIINIELFFVCSGAGKDFIIYQRFFEFHFLLDENLSVHLIIMFFFSLFVYQLLRHDGVLSALSSVLNMQSWKSQGNWFLSNFSICKCLPGKVMSLSLCRQTYCAVIDFLTSGWLYKNVIFSSEKKKSKFIRLHIH